MLQIIVEKWLLIVVSGYLGLLTWQFAFSKCSHMCFGSELILENNPPFSEYLIDRESYIPELNYMVFGD